MYVCRSVLESTLGAVSDSAHHLTYATAPHFHRNYEVNQTIVSLGVDLPCRLHLFWCSTSGSKLKYFGHVVRAENLSTDILHGRVNGIRSRSRPKWCWSDDVKDCTGLGLSIPECITMARWISFVSSSLVFNLRRWGRTNNNTSEISWNWYNFLTMSYLRRLLLLLKIHTFIIVYFLYISLKALIIHAIYGSEWLFCADVLLRNYYSLTRTCLCLSVCLSLFSLLLKMIVFFQFLFVILYRFYSDFIILNSCLMHKHIYLLLGLVPVYIFLCVY